MDFESLKTKFVSKYKKGEQQFYRYLIIYALNKLRAMKDDEYNGISPELEFLEYYDGFLKLYRRENNGIYLELAKIFRKTAHKIYRVMLRKNLTSINTKFLNLV